MTARPLARFAPLAAAALLAAVSLACSGSEGRRIDIAAGEGPGSAMYFEPNTITVQPGEKITFYVRNDGSGDHEFESDEAAIEEVVIPKGRLRKITWTAPQRGEYPIYCDITGHRQAGMELIVRVQPAQ
ncbi:cupredoxin domain-containing protein [Tepidiforma flava]|uniref:Cupredoxin domain-containing protein n=1 Tax=Tepidiforma flava TaxID=3004094 RepID=A0ABY7MC11_9CHLR|nr:cupredoxin domain-containing protein [Tepidiforma flava]WBL37091.1 cupredoxin domain-containing protein [Tepidiforma flava]